MKSCLSSLIIWDNCTQKFFQRKRTKGGKCCLLLEQAAKFFVSEELHKIWEWLTHHQLSMLVSCQTEGKSGISLIPKWYQFLNTNIKYFTAFINPGHSMYMNEGVNLGDMYFHNKQNYLSNVHFYYQVEDRNWVLSFSWHVF